MHPPNQNTITGLISVNEFLLNECISVDHGFSYIRKAGTNIKSSDPHMDKDIFAVFILLEGSIDFVVEGKRISLEPYDVMIVNNHELHHSITKENSKIDFILLTINLDFFLKNDCIDFSDMVFNRMIGTNNVIPAEVVKRSGINDIFLKLEKYTMEENECTIVIKSVIIELLYNLNKQISKVNVTKHGYTKIKDVLEYINEHLTEKITLDTIANKFFFTKQYLCRFFKEQTGFTIKKYIAYKRIVIMRELCSKGISLSEASIKAGFNSYSSFYRTYSKIMNQSPKNNLTNFKL